MVRLWVLYVRRFTRALAWTAALQSCHCWQRRQVGKRAGLEVVGWVANSSPSNMLCWGTRLLGNLVAAVWLQYVRMA